MYEAVKSLGIAAAFTEAILNPAMWINIAAAVVGATAGWIAFDQIVGTNKDNLLGALPSLKAFNESFVKQKEVASTATKVLLEQAQAQLQVAQSALIAAEAQASGTDSSSKITEKGADNVATKTEPMLGRCKECAVLPVYTLTTHLCFPCEMDRRGLEYDEESNRYIKPKRRK
jgi:hypothetical protein